MALAAIKRNNLHQENKGNKQLFDRNFIVEYINSTSCKSKQRRKRNQEKD